MLAQLAPKARKPMENLVHQEARRNKLWNENVTTVDDLETLGNLHARRLDARRGASEFSDHGPVGEYRKPICTWWMPADYGRRVFERVVVDDAINTLLMERTTARAMGREQWARWLITCRG